MSEHDGAASLVRSDALLAGATVHLRRKECGWRAFVVVDDAQLSGDAHSPAMALVALGHKIDNWAHAFDAPANA